MTSRLLALAALLAALSCDNSFFLRGTLDGDCDPPRSIITVMGGPDADTIRKSNCQPPQAVCCRRSSEATRTSCQYPEDCYVAPYMGKCATAVDCSNTQECMDGICQCTLGGPPCEDPMSHLTVCCAAGEICMMGVCQAPTM